MTLVVDVDGDVKLVLQGGLPFGRGLLGPLQRGPKPRAHGPSSGPGHFDFWEFASPPELSERFQRAVPLIPPSAFQGEGFGRLPGDLAELLERFRQDLHDLDPSEGEAGSGTEGLTH